MLSISPKNLILVPCFFLWVTYWFHLCILLAIPKYKYIKMAVRLRIYTNNLRVNKEVSAIPTLPEAQVLCTQKFTKENHT